MPLTASGMGSAMGAGLGSDMGGENASGGTARGGISEAVGKRCPDAARQCAAVALPKRRSM
jgi:hypothetical protein